MNRKLIAVFIVLLSLVLVYFLGINNQSIKKKKVSHMALSDWIKKGLSLPGNRGDQPKSLTALGKDSGEVYKTISRVLAKTAKQMRKELLEFNWLPSGKGKWELEKAKDRKFQPYARKLILPEGSRCFIFGDLHGDLRTLLKALEKFQKEGLLDEQYKLTNKSTYVAFLGDYTDRGHYGLEVIYTILRLKLANPERVFTVRGNHEDLLINSKAGFMKEVREKTKKKSKKTLDQINAFYSLMPVALYLGHKDNFMQACHGGLELGYDVDPFLNDKSAVFDLINPVDRKSFYKKIQKVFMDSSRSHLADIIEKRVKKKDRYLVEGPKSFKSPTDYSHLGLMWYDFVFDPDDFVSFRKGRGFVYGRELTRESLSLLSPKLKAVVRAHQHGEKVIMQELIKSHGLFRFWEPSTVKDSEAEISLPVKEGDVFMLNFGVDTDRAAKYGFSNSTFGELRVRDDFSQWRMILHEVNVID